MREILKPQNPQLLRQTNINDVLGLPPLARPGQIYLITGHSSLIRPVAQELLHRFAILGELRVILGGNRFSLERLPLLLGDDIARLPEVLNGVKISRGETCYQLLDALKQTETSQIPLIVMDMLDSFYDEDLTEREVERVLADSLAHVQRLSKKAPLLLSASANPGREQLLDTLRDTAEYSIELKPENNGQAVAQLDLL
jgi:hypothetical protein